MKVPDETEAILTNQFCIAKGLRNTLYETTAISYNDWNSKGSSDMGGQS